MVLVTVNASPLELTVAVGDSSDDHTIVPADDALNVPTFPIVTGSESFEFAVNVRVKVNVDVPGVCAYVAIPRISPPLAVVISPDRVVSPADGDVVFAVIARYSAHAGRPLVLLKASATKSLPAL